MRGPSISPENLEKRKDVLEKTKLDHEGADCKGKKISRSLFSS